MTSTAAINGAWTPTGRDSAIPPQLTYPLAASSQVGRGQFATVSLTTGFAALNDGTTPGQMPAGNGYPAPLSGLDTTAGAAVASFWIGFGGSTPASTVSLDGFTVADVCTPFYIADENTAGKLSHNGASNRSLGGLVLGLDGTGNPRTFSGPIGWTLARATTIADAAAAGLVAYPVDAGATTDIGSTSAATSSLIIPRTKTHGTLTSIEIIPSAALSATSGNDRTITVWKVDTLGVAAAVSVGTFTTTTALVARVAASFTLSAVAGALNMLETDILTYSTVHAASGAVIPQSAIRANMKVL